MSWPSIREWFGHRTPASRTTPTGTGHTFRHKTADWFDDEALERVATRYRDFAVSPLSYATVRDYCDSFDHLRPLATANSDLKDVQRPWILKAILSRIPRGGRLLEIGAGEPFVADLLQRLDYRVTIVDPYDGSGKGPQEHEIFRRQCPDIQFVREHFSDATSELSPRSFDCIYSISVLEHVSDESLPGVFSGLAKFLKSEGLTIHAIDHVQKGQGADFHLKRLRTMLLAFGLAPENLSRMLDAMILDTETYYLSAEAHNRWRANTSYDEFPMRVCVSVQTCTRAHALADTAMEKHRT